MHRFATAFVLVVAVGLSGCYHARVSTGLTPSNETIEQSFASSWIYGLVPPAEIDASRCANGVARVETQLSFVNQLVTFITFGIYSPMSITVTCATSGSSDAGSSVLEVASANEAESALMSAAEQAVASGEPVFVRYLY